MDEQQFNEQSKVYATVLFENWRNNRKPNLVSFCGQRAIEMNAFEAIAVLEVVTVATLQLVVSGARMDGAKGLRLDSDGTIAIAYELS